MRRIDGRNISRADGNRPGEANRANFPGRRLRGIYREKPIDVNKVNLIIKNMQKDNSIARIEVRNLLPLREAIRKLKLAGQIEIKPPILDWVETKFLLKYIATPVI